MELQLKLCVHMGKVYYCENAHLQMLPVVIYISNGTISDGDNPLNNSFGGSTRPSASYFSYYLDGWFRIRFNIF